MPHADYYWHILSAHPQTLIQHVRYLSQRFEYEPEMPLEDSIFKTPLTLKEIVHLANGGAVRRSHRSSFEYITEGIVSKKKLHHPFKFLEQHALVTGLPDPANRHGKTLRVYLTEEGVWVYEMMRIILIELIIGEINADAATVTKLEFVDDDD